MNKFVVKNFTFKLLLSLPLLLLLWDTFVNIYYWYFDFSFVVQISLLLLWSMEMWWLFKNGTVPPPVLLTSAFVVIYLGFAVDNPPKLGAYLSDALWALLYTYVLGDCYKKLSKKTTASTQEASFSEKA